MSTIHYLKHFRARFFWNVAIYRFWKGFTQHRPYLLQWDPRLHLSSSMLIFLLNRNIDVGEVLKTSWLSALELSLYRTHWPSGTHPGGLAQKD